MLEIKDLSLKYNDTAVLNNLNLTASRGELIVITGSSGSGKSSILKAINGIIPYHQKVDISGDILFDGKSIMDKDIQHRSAFLSTVFQNPNNQFYCINSTDEMAFPLENRNVQREVILSKIDEHTKLLHTAHLKDKSLMDLSGGQKQLVAITSVSVLDEDIYLLDEPSASLDAESIQRLAYAIKKWKELGKIIIIAEHRLYFLTDMLDKLLVIEDGKLTENPVTTHLRTKERTTLEDISKNHFYKVQHVFEKKLEKGEITFEGYKYAYDKKPVLDMNMSLSIDKITFIIGKNGVGKSTLMHCLCGLNKGFKGITTIKDLTFKKKGYKHCALVMQDVNYQLFTESVYEEIKLATNDEGKIDNILKLLNLDNKKEDHPMSLSGGQKQRVAIGNAWASDKKIIIFDEPTSGLCYGSMVSIKKILEELKNSGKKVIVITHDYEFINSFREEEIIHMVK